MARKHWNRWFFASRRGQIITLLRRSSRTADELAQALGLTHTAVRAHLAALERDGLVHQAAHVLANHENESSQAVRERYEQVLRTMREQQASLGPLSEAISTFLKVTANYWPGLFHC